tara:strand:+ start:142 stop:501 length:360 start_codon:yes stop_codon:yes gene_type:complete
MGKNRSWLVISTTGLLAVAFLIAGIPKLTGAEGMAENFDRFGLSISFMRFIGVSEVAGAIGLFLPRLAPLAAGGLAVIVAGAAVLHFVHDPAPQAIPAGVLTALCVFLAYRRRGDLFQV